MASFAYDHRSRHIFGTGIVLTGALVLSIGLIVGLEFPKYIKERRLARSCITSNLSHDYMDWLHNRNQTKYIFLQIWNMTNANAFIHFGEAPKVLGPYVFVENEVKLDVSFQKGLLKYQSWKKQTYQEILTRKLCANCSRSDKISTINPAFLRLVNSYMDESSYYLSLIPKLLASHRLRVLEKIQDGLNGSSTTKPWSWTISEVDFDDWIRRSNTNYKATILQDKTSPTTLASFLRIYDTLTNPAIYGTEILKRKDWWGLCEHHYKDVLESHFANSSGEVQGPVCGLIFYFYKLGTSSLTNWHVFRPQLSSLLCDRRSRTAGPCFLSLDRDSDTRLVRAYLEAMIRYTISYLPQLLKSKSPPLNAIKMHETLTLDDLALGYYVDGLSLQRVSADRGHSGSLWPQVCHVRGLLEHHDSEAMAKADARRITLRTCLFNKSRNDNLNMEGINLEETPCLRDLYPPETVDAGGLQRFKTLPAQKLIPCLGPRPPESTYKFFVEEMWRPVDYVHTGSTHYDWVQLCNFNMQLHEASLSTYGLSTSAATGYLSWVNPVAPSSLPELPLGLDQWQINDFEPGGSSGNQTEWPKNRNRILIEPVTGEIWSSESHMRVYTGLKKKFFDDPGIINNNTSCLDRPIEYFEVYSKTEPSRQLILKYRKEVHILLQASCGGLIAFSIVGSIIILVGFGIVFAVIHRPPYKVGPDLSASCDGTNVNKGDQESLDNPHS